MIMTINNFSIYCQEIQREVNFDLAENYYYCDLYLDQNLLSQNTLIKATDSAITLEYQAKKYLTEQLKNKDILLKANTFSDFNLLKINNNFVPVDHVNPFFEKHLIKVTEQNELLPINYIKSYSLSNQESITNEQSDILNSIADFIVLSDDPVCNLNQTLTDYENYKNNLLTLSLLNLARLNKKLILFNAAVKYLNSKKYTCSDVFDDRFFKEKKLKNNFSSNSLKTEKDLIKTLFNAARDYAIDHFIKNSVTSSFLSFNRSVNYKLSLEAIKNNNFISIILSTKLTPIAQLNYLEVLSNENSINTFLTRIAPGFKNSSYDLFNEIYKPCMSYMTDVLKLDLIKN